MTGLFGYFNRSRDADPRQAVARIGESMRRHPYHQVDLAAAGPSGALGRLHIGLLNREPQPVCDSDSGISLFLCGELYHQEQIRRQLKMTSGIEPDADDSELLLHLYRVDGIEALTTVPGMFVAAVWDGPAGNLWIVNDRFGLYPHFYAHTDGAFVLAPEMRGILEAPGIPRKLDHTAVAQYVRFQQMLGERTWFEDIRLLPPATILNYRPAEDRLVLRKYWDWDQIPPQPSDISLSDAADETIRLFQRGIDAMIRPPLRVGVFLSGGLDGRAILGVARDSVDVATFTFGAPGSRDVHYARKIAKRSGSAHHWFPFEDGRWVADHARQHLNLTEGQHSWMHAHGISMLPSVRALVDVNLSGWDGGTILGGFIVAPGSDGKFRHASDEREFTDRFFEGFCREFVWPGLTDDEADRLFSEPGNSALRGLARASLAEEIARFAHYPLPNRADIFYTLQHCRRSTQSMIVFTRSAVEVRCPYFDYELISFLFGLPENLRSSLALQHLVLTRRMPDLARIPNEKDQLPPHANQALRSTYRAMRRARRIANRVAPFFPEQPRLYADYEEYLRNELVDWAEAILFNRRALERGLFNPIVVQELWDLHRRGEHPWTIGKIAPLITIEMVLRRFFDGEPDFGALPTAGP